MTAANEIIPEQAREEHGIIFRPSGENEENKDGDENEVENDKEVEQ